MSEKTREKPGTFESEFNTRLNGIIKRAKDAGLTITDLCKKAGTARATPDRWRKRAPLSVKLLDKLESVVASAEQAKADQQR